MPCSFDNIEDEYLKIIHIPDKLPIQPHLQPTVNAYASVIDPKYANTLVRKLNHISPLGNLRHVKRVRKKCVEGNIQLCMILSLAFDNNGDMDDMPSDMVELIKSYRLSTFITKVPKYAATSKEEWEEQCKLWPTSYHPPIYNISGITGFNEEESQSVFKLMKFAVDLAKSVDGQIVNAAVIVDPASNQVVASSCDRGFSQDKSSTKGRIRARSLEHCEDASSLCRINGLQNHTTSGSNSSIDEPKRSYNDVSCLHPWQWAEQQSLTSCFWHPFHHAAMLAIEYSAARDRHLYPSSEHIGVKCDQAISMDSSSTVSTSKRQKTNTNVEDSGRQIGESNGCDSASARPYLCTGYDIYLVWEPCIMCSMALVHQRIKRIFYAFPNPNTGALGSVHRLQGEKSLNHHYAAFRVLLPESILEKGEPIVSVQWLHSHLQDPNIKVLDGSFYMPFEQRNALQEYQDTRIPGALFFDIEGISDQTTDLPHMLPSEEAFAAAISALGVRNEDMIVVYDGKGIFGAARVWWMFRVFGHDKVSVLDGGMPRWRDSRFDVETGASIVGLLKVRAASKAIEKVYKGQPVLHVTFQAKFQPHLIWTLKQIQKNMHEKSHQHIDARPKPRFDGVAPEPREGIRSGHIPGSKCISFPQMMDDLQTLLSPMKLGEKFKHVGISLENPIVISSASGVTACIVAMGLYRLGKPDIPVYDGSWTEWVTHPDTHNIVEAAETL